MISQRGNHGGVAQLGERLNGIQEVMGSIPTVSTKKALQTVCLQGFFYSAVFMELFFNQAMFSSEDMDELVKAAADLFNKILQVNRPSFSE